MQIIELDIISGIVLSCGRRCIKLFLVDEIGSYIELCVYSVIEF